MNKIMKEKLPYYRPGGWIWYFSSFGDRPLCLPLAYALVHNERNICIVQHFGVRIQFDPVESVCEIV